MKSGNRRQGDGKFFSTERNVPARPIEPWLVSLDLRRATTRGPMMNSRFFAASALSTAVGLALAMQASPVQGQGMQNPPQIVKDNMARMAQQHLEKCYGINAVSKNDCAEGAHSCAGQSTQAHDLKSFVLLPAGDCGKISGGSLKPA
jgi:uncharacterized membrane protein